MMEVTRGRALAAGGLLLAISALAGCGGSDQLEVYPVQGKLLLDGEPFGPTSIMLVPVNSSEKGDTHSAQGKVDSSGNIQFTTYEQGDGVAAGEYKVVVGMDMAEPPKPFPRIYRNAQESPLTVSIKPEDQNQVTIDMDSKAGPPVPPIGFGKKAPDMDAAASDPAFSAGAKKEE